MNERRAFIDAYALFNIAVIRGQFSTIRCLAILIQQPAYVLVCDSNGQTVRRMKRNSLTLSKQLHCSAHTRMIEPSRSLNHTMAVMSAAWLAIARIPDIDRLFLLPYYVCIFGCVKPLRCSDGIPGAEQRKNNQKMTKSVLLLKLNSHSHRTNMTTATVAILSWINIFFVMFLLFSQEKYMFGLKSAEQCQFECSHFYAIIVCSRIFFSIFALVILHLIGYNNNNNDMIYVNLQFSLRFPPQIPVRRIDDS